MGEPEPQTAYSAEAGERGQRLRGRARRLGARARVWNDRLKFASFRRRAGTVTDSVCAEVSYEWSDETHAFRITAAALPVTIVSIYVRELGATLDVARCTIGDARAEIRPGRNAFRRKTYTATALLGAVEYRLRPRSGRRARFYRAGDRLADLRRPRFGQRRVRWRDEGAQPAERALAHAMAAASGVGAPGFLANTVGEMDF